MAGRGSKVVLVGADKQHCYELMRCHFSRKFPTFNEHIQKLCMETVFFFFFFFFFPPKQTIGCTDLPE